MTQADDVLFGEVWNDESIDIKTRCIITVTALMASGVTDSSLKYHLVNARNNGVTRAEIAAVITHVGMYTGWPKAWAVFSLAKEVWPERVLPGEPEDEASLTEEGEEAAPAGGTETDRNSRAEEKKNVDGEAEGTETADSTGSGKDPAVEAALHDGEKEDKPDSAGESTPARKSFFKKKKK